MKTIKQFPAWFAKQKLSGKLFIGCSSAFIFLCLCIFSVALLSPSTPSTDSMEVSSLQTAAVETVLAQTHQTATANAPTSTPEPTGTPVIDENVKAIMEGTGLSQNDAEKAFEAIKSVGFTQVERLTFLDEKDGMKAYSASLGYTKDFLVTFYGSEVFGISLDSAVFYDRDAGGALDTIKNYTLDMNEKSTFIYLAQENVKQALTSPSTAEFPSLVFNLDQWRVVREKDIVWVQSWVDADNAFGARIRNQFLAQYSYSTQQLLYLELEGNVVYGSPQKP